MKVCRLGGFFFLAESSASKGRRFPSGNDLERFFISGFLKSGEESDGFEKTSLLLISSVAWVSQEHFTWHAGNSRMLYLQHSSSGRGLRLAAEREAAVTTE